MQESEHRYSGMEWTFYIVILPMLFTALLVGIILQFLGWDITGKIGHAARAIPGVSKILPAEPQETAANGETQADPAKQLQDAQDQIKSLEDTKKQLESDMVKKDSEITNLKKQIDDLKKKPDAKKDGSTTGTASTTDPFVQQAQVYAQMSPTKAAAVMSQLSVTEVKHIFSKMTNEQQAAILEKMDPAIASKILSS